jgi:hypothetical protein
MLKKSYIWTWILPEAPWAELPPGWKDRGGKWLVYGSLKDIERLASKLDISVQRGEVDSAKYWNASETSAMCVYCWEEEKGRTRKILEDFGFKPTAWEYDYARRKNWIRPEFHISAFYKLRIVLKTFGVKGSLKYIFSYYWEAIKSSLD